jgi:hypothetical protein
LAAYQPEWVEPISVNYRGYDVWELPPNGHGLVTLLALNILQGIEFAQKEVADTYHQQIEAIKLAFADGLKYIADPRQMRIGVADLLTAAYAAERRKLIGSEAALPANPLKAALFTWQRRTVRGIWFPTFRAIIWGLVRGWSCREPGLRCTTEAVIFLSIPRMPMRWHQENDPITQLYPVF